MTDNFQPATRPGNSREQIRQILPRAFNARRNNAGGNHRRLEQSQIIAGKIEHLAKLL